MSMATPPGASRGQPPLEQAAQDVIRSVRAPYHPPPEWITTGYEPAELTDEERAEAAKAADLARICQYCMGEHVFPTSIGCPRIAEAVLNGEGKITAVKFWPGTGWAKGRVVFFEDLHEPEKKKASDGGS